MARSEETPTMTAAGEREALIRAGCTAANVHLVCAYPNCSCDIVPRAVDAVLSALSQRDAAGMVEWHTDNWGAEGRMLKFGRFCVGNIQALGSRDQLPFRAWIQDDDEGVLLGRFETEEEAKNCLFNAAQAALEKAVKGE